MNKAEIRTAMKLLRSKYSKEEMLHFSQLIKNHLYSLKEYQNAKHILTYLSFGSEIDTWQLIRDHLKGDYQTPKHIYLPKVEGKQMNFYRIDDLDHLISSKFGVQEPDSDIHLLYDKDGYSKYRLNQPLMIMPGLAFDCSGNRVGYGGGYYDRYLAAHGHNNFIKVALGLDTQILDKIETHPLDIKVDYIITPTEIITCRYHS